VLTDGARAITARDVSEAEKSDYRLMRDRLNFKLKYMISSNEKKEIQRELKPIAEFQEWLFDGKPFENDGNLPVEFYQDVMKIGESLNRLTRDVIKIAKKHVNNGTITTTLDVLVRELIEVGNLCFGFADDDDDNN